MIFTTTSDGLGDQNERKSILIVEDDPNLRTFYGDALGGEYGIIVVSSGEEAMRHLSVSGAFDLVILDYGLPGMSGIDVLKELRRVDPFIPVMMVTVHGYDAIVEESFRLGAVEFLEKPFSVRDLIEKVNAYLPGNARPKKKSG